MAWLVVDKDNTEAIYAYKPRRINRITGSFWGMGGNNIELPKGSIKKLIGRDLTWKDEPIELK